MDEHRSDLQALLAPLYSDDWRAVWGAFTTLERRHDPVLVEICVGIVHRHPNASLRAHVAWMFMIQADAVRDKAEVVRALAAALDDGA